MNSFDNLKQTIASLRAPDGCPWDKEQTHLSIRACLIEECAELLEALESQDSNHIEEELGDVLLQVFLHAQIKDEEGIFSIEDVANKLNEKLISRHPHVFKNEKIASSSDEAINSWENMKKLENKPQNKTDGPLKKLPPSLNGLIYASSLRKQMKKLNLSSTKISEPNIENLAKENDTYSFGKMLFEISSACKDKNINPEEALRDFICEFKNDIEKNYKKQ